MKFHDELNPKLWQGFELKEEVKDKLEEITEAFIEYLDIPAESILDVQITGSSANYNYTEHSDLDLHLIVDYEKVHQECPIVEGYLWSMKSAFNREHDISIYGIQVEVYAEDSRQSAVSNGVYSLLDDKWIKKPEKVPPTENDAAVEAKYNEIKDIVDKLDDSEEAEEVLNKVYEMRKAGLSKEGEYSTENLAFKKLRNEGYIDMLKKIKKQKIDKELSLESYNEDNQNKTQNSLQRKAGTTKDFWISSDIDKLLTEFTEQQLNSYVIVNSSFRQYAEGPTGADRSERIFIPYNWNVETVGWTKKEIPASYLKQSNLKTYSRKGKPTGGYGYIGAEKVTWKVMTLRRALETYKDWKTGWSDHITMQPLKDCPDNAIKSTKINKELSLESYNESDNDLTNFCIIIDGDYNWLEEYGTFKSCKAAQEWLDKYGEEEWMYSQLTKGEMKDLGIDEYGGYVNESINESVKKLTANDIINIYNKLGYYYVGKENETRTIVSIDKETIPNMTELLEKNLRQSGKYGWYHAVPVMAVEQNRVKDFLPIYGYTDHYETKWLQPTKEDAIKDDFRSLKSSSFNEATKNFEALGLDNDIIKMLIFGRAKYVLYKLKEGKLARFVINQENYYEGYEAKGLIISIDKGVKEKIEEFLEENNFKYEYLENANKNESMKEENNCGWKKFGKNGEILKCGDYVAKIVPQAVGNNYIATLNIKYKKQPLNMQTFEDKEEAKKWLENKLPKNESINESETQARLVFDLTNENGITFETDIYVYKDEDGDLYCNIPKHKKLGKDQKAVGNTIKSLQDVAKREFEKEGYDVKVKSVEYPSKNESIKEDKQKLNTNDFKIEKTDSGLYKVAYDSRIGYIKPDKNYFKVERALGNAVYKYNTEDTLANRKALISKLHKLFKQAGIPKMKDMTSSVRGYRPITKHGYYMTIYSGNRTSFIIGLSKFNEEYFNKIKQILDSEGIKYWEGSDHFSVDLENQDIKNESIKENIYGTKSTQKNEALNLDKLTDTDAEQLIMYLNDFTKDKASKYYHIDKIEAILKKYEKNESIKEEFFVGNDKYIIIPVSYANNDIRILDKKTGEFLKDENGDNLKFSTEEECGNYIKSLDESIKEDYGKYFYIIAQKANGDWFEDLPEFKGNRFKTSMEAKKVAEKVYNSGKYANVSVYSNQSEYRAIKNYGKPVYGGRLVKYDTLEEQLEVMKEPKSIKDINEYIERSGLIEKSNQDEYQFTDKAKQFIYSDEYSKQESYGNLKMLNKRIEKSLRD